MNNGSSPDPLKPFEERWKEWAAQPSKTAAEIAAREISLRIGQQKKTAHTLRLTFVFSVTGTALLIALILFMLPNAPGGPVSNTPGAVPIAATHGTPVSEDLVVIWLTPETPLYMAFKKPLIETEDLHESI